MKSFSFQDKHIEDFTHSTIKYTSLNRIKFSSKKRLIRVNIINQEQKRERKVSIVDIIPFPIIILPKQYIITYCTRQNPRNLQFKQKTLTNKRFNIKREQITKKSLELWLAYEPVVHMPKIHLTVLNHGPVAFLPKLNSTRMIYLNQPDHKQVSWQKGECNRFWRSSAVFYLIFVRGKQLPKL